MSECLVHLLRLISFMGNRRISGKRNYKVITEFEIGLQFSYFHALILLWSLQQHLNKVFTHCINLIVYISINIIDLHSNLMKGKLFGIYNLQYWKHTCYIQPCWWFFKFSNTRLINTNLLFSIIAWLSLQFIKIEKKINKKMNSYLFKTVWNNSLLSSRDWDRHQKGRAVKMIQTGHSNDLDKYQELFISTHIWLS